MNTGILLQSENDRNHSKTDGMRKHDSKNISTPGTGPESQQKQTATCKPKGSNPKLPYQEIQRLHEQGLTGVAIAKQLGLKPSSPWWKRSFSSRRAKGCLMVHGTTQAWGEGGHTLSKPGLLPRPRAAAAKGLKTAPPDSPAGPEACPDPKAGA